MREKKKTASETILNYLYLRSPLVMGRNDSGRTGHRAKRPTSALFTRFFRSGQTKRETKQKIQNRNNAACPKNKGGADFKQDRIKIEYWKRFTECYYIYNVPPRKLTLDRWRNILCPWPLDSILGLFATIVLCYLSVLAWETSHNCFWGWD